MSMADQNMMKFDHLVADTGAFIRNANLFELANNVYTCPEVISEIKDKATKQRLLALPYELKFKEPSSKNISKIVDMSKVSGDYSSLSHTDIKVLALTYELTCKYEPETEINENIKSKSEVQMGRNNIPESALLGFYMPGDKKAPEDSKQMLIHNEQTAENEKAALEDAEDFAGDGEEKHAEIPKQNNSVISSDKPSPVDELIGNMEGTGLEDNDSGDDNEGWITPALLNEIKSVESNDEPEEIAQVGCLTTDFAMQNVLLKMNLHVVAVDGLLIKTARSYVLRCHACFHVTKTMGKVFCPKCGNKTLKRVPVEMQPDGTLKMFFSKNPKVLNPRGLRYSLPKPQGGKHSHNPLLCEDQRMPHDRPSRKALRKTDVWSDDYDCSTSPFASNEINSRAFRLGVREGQRSRKGNPNSVGRKFVKKR